MKVGMRRTIRWTLGMGIVCLLGISSGHGQTPEGATAQKPLMAEDAFKNVQVLRGIPVKEFMDTMGFFSASTGLNCQDCHTKDSAGNWEKYADDTQMKDTARRMVVMVKSINQADFGGERRVTCYTCHAGNASPQVLPSLTVQYGPPPMEDPDEVQSPENPPQTPSADQILDKYVQAVGGSQQLAKLKSFSAKGTYEGFDTELQKVPVEIYGQAPDKLVTIVHFAYGDSTSTYDGQQAWVATPKELAPVPVMPLLGGDLEGARVDAQISFPVQIKQDFIKWQAGFPTTTVDNHPTQVVEGTTSTGDRVKLYFDKQSGLLLRQTHYTNTPVGRTPTHVEYSDYRAVNGVQIPFHWEVTWVDGQSTVQLTEFKPNVRIEESKFAKPAPPVEKQTP
jgi:photosynthetic reaction center cytochrome c subunit